MNITENLTRLSVEHNHQAASSHTYIQESIQDFMAVLAWPISRRTEFWKAGPLKTCRRDGVQYPMISAKTTCKLSGADREGWQIPPLLHILVGEHLTNNLYSRIVQCFLHKWCFIPLPNTLSLQRPRHWRTLMLRDHFSQVGYSGLQAMECLTVSHY